jgi:hypothetical protein
MKESTATILESIHILVGYTLIRLIHSTCSKVCSFFPLLVLFQGMDLLTAWTKDCRHCTVRDPPCSVTISAEPGRGMIDLSCVETLRYYPDNNFSWAACRKIRKLFRPWNQKNQTCHSRTASSYRNETADGVESTRHQRTKPLCSNAKMAGFAFSTVTFLPM